MNRERITAVEEAGHDAAARRKWTEGEIAVIFPAGYGFISTGQGRPQVFVRMTEVPVEFWNVGQRLRFQTRPPVKGRSWVAVHVQAVDKDGKAL